MASPTHDIFLDARTLQELSQNSGAANFSYANLVSNAMLTAAGNGLRTSTTTTSGKAGADVLNVMHRLNLLGHRAVLQGTNLIVTW